MTISATETAARWLRENGYGRHAQIREAVEVATGQAVDYGKVYALALWSGDEHVCRTVRDALKANLSLSWYGELGNCAPSK
jgi:hypothetical protein